MKGLPQKVQIVRIDRASQRAGLVMPQQKFQMQVVQKVQTTVASRAKQSAVIGTQRP
uniref:Uncharacterized protein n=1 Tax=Romanomermis culicivorax TaxID=13658 RepID=A0A915IZ92_ROMCU